MQTGIFFVRLKKSIDPNEQGMELAGRIERLGELFDPEAAYPVLAVEYRESNKIKTTFYHMPTKNNDLDWFSSEYFAFANP